jgi:hypothetical protein
MYAVGKIAEEDEDWDAIEDIIKLRREDSLPIAPI